MKYLPIFLSVILSACSVMLMPSYSWSACRLEGGSLVDFGCSVNQYADNWRQEAESKALEIIPRDFAARSEPHESIVILRTSLSEGGRAGVYMAVGSKSFTDEWEKNGAHAAGLKDSEQWAKNNGPSFTNKSKPKK